MPDPLTPLTELLDAGTPGEELTWEHLADGGIYISTHPGGHMASRTETLLIARLREAEAALRRIREEARIGNGHAIPAMVDRYLTQGGTDG